MRFAMMSALLIAVISAPRSVHPETAEKQPSAPGSTDKTVPSADQEGQNGPQGTAQPGGLPPAEAPPTPPHQPPPPPPAEHAPAQTQAGNGQWVYTGQYGWIWIPYGDQYVYTPEDTSAYPSTFVYDPAIGWTWVISPWVWGWGPLPYFGYYGPWRYPWYRGPGYVHPPGRAWPPRTWYHGGYRGPSRPAPGHGGGRPPSGRHPPGGGHGGGPHR